MCAFVDTTLKDTEKVIASSAQQVHFLNLHLF